MHFVANNHQPRAAPLFPAEAVAEGVQAQQRAQAPPPLARPGRDEEEEVVFALRKVVHERQVGQRQEGGGELDSRRVQLEDAQAGRQSHG